MVLKPDERRRQEVLAARSASRSSTQTNTGDGTPSTEQSSSSSNTGGKSPTLSKELRLSMSEMSKKIGNLAQTNYYHVQFTLSPKLVTHFSTSYSNDPTLKNIGKFVNEKLGYLCSEATLPVSSFATAEVKDNYMGIPQEFAHTRLYTDMDLTFYIDDDYSVLRFFEGWMDYIGGGNRGEDKKNNIPAEPAIGTSNSPHAYRRFNWPDDYKLQTLNVIKFERDFKTKLVYNFVNAFPKGLTAMPVSYGTADLLKVTATFNFDRYVVSREAMSVSETKESARTSEDERALAATRLGLSNDDLKRLGFGVALPAAK